MILLAMAS